MNTPSNSDMTPQRKRHTSNTGRRQGKQHTPNTSRDRGRGGTRGGGRSDRGGQARQYTEAERLQHQLRPVRANHHDPIIPESVNINELHPSARNELKTLQPDLQERVAAHLVMVAQLIDTDPELAHQHALSACRRAGRIPVARETLAITAYRTGDFALALRELRTYRRLSGNDDHIALMVDCERGLGRPEKAVEVGLEAQTRTFSTEQRVYLAIAMSGARLDLHQTQQALYELHIPELDPSKAYSWSAELFAAYSAVLEDLGNNEEASKWCRLADRAAEAWREHIGGFDSMHVFEVVELREPVEAPNLVPPAEPVEPVEAPNLVPPAETVEPAEGAQPDTTPTPAKKASPPENHSHPENHSQPGTEPDTTRQAGSEQQ